MVEAYGMIFIHRWGGRSGTYETVKLRASSRDELITRLEKMNGDFRELDSGMGCESAPGVYLRVFETKHEDGWESRRVLDPIIFVDKLNETQKEFLLSCF